MDKYKKLVSNTFIFAIGTFSSKFLVFILMPFYTRVLSTSDYGIVDLIVQTSNLLIPVVTVGITNAVIRFGLERETDQKGVFTVGLVTILSGFLVLCACEPLLSKVKFLTSYTMMIYFFVLMSSLHSLCAQFIRAKGMVKLYAFDGVARTVLMIVLNLLFLGPFGLGVNGYVLANILSDFISSVFLFFFAQLYHFIRIKSMTKEITLNMLRYSIPLIPALVCSWIVNISDRYMISYMIGSSANGIYAIANKIPTVLLLVSNIFTDAWQISAVSEEEKTVRENFFSKVCGVYQSTAFVTASGLIMTAKLTTYILASKEFYSAWMYIPTLVMGTTFACLANFLASIYMVEKKSGRTFYTTMLAAIGNVLLNLILIPRIGVIGAAIATFLSYFIMFFVRAVDSRRLIRIRWNLPRFLICFGVILLQSLIIGSKIKFWIFYEVLLFLVILFLNLKDLLSAVKRVAN